MIQSMTGYGKSVKEANGRKITAELKSLNSKSLDLNIRMPQSYRELELPFREMIAKHLGRGKVDLFFNVEITDVAAQGALNEPVVLAYLKQLQAIKHKADVNGDSLAAVMRLPDVLKQAETELTEEDKQLALACLEEAAIKLNQYRTQEGKSLEADFNERLRLIAAGLEEVGKYEGVRIQAVRDRLNKQLEELKGGYDPNRLEQELIFYLEKLDINEEKVRLSTHLSYFKEVMAEDQPGKKLGFIAQEIGREINTIGSKSNHATMQRAVVQMKDELEKIKEQVNNAL